MTKNNKKRSVRAAFTVLISIALVVLGVLIFMYRDYLTPERIGEIFGGGKNIPTDAEPFTYETSSNQVFAAVGDGLAMASSSGIRLFDGNGGLVASQVSSLARPSVAASKDYAAFFDIGSKNLKVATLDGEIKNLDIDRTITGCTVNKNGWMCVITEYTGQRGKVSVYDSSFGPVFEWNSGSRYVLSASVSPDNRFLAILCVGMEGSTVLVFSLSSDVEYGSFFAVDELFVDMAFGENDRICAISEERAVFFDLEGNALGEYDFGEMYLTDYTLGGDSFVGLLLGKYRSGNEGKLVTLDNGGRMLGELEVMNDYLSLSARGSEFLTLAADGLTLYSDRLVKKGTLEDLSGVKSAVLLDGGAAFLLSTYAAEKYKF